MELRDANDLLLPGHLELEIRAYDPERDHDGVRACMVELQDFERELDPRMPAGESIADAYLERMFGRCREFDGSVLVAEHGGSIRGFVTVWARYRSAEPDDDPAAHAFLSDLVVASGHRGLGIGRALLRAAEACAREVGAPHLQLTVKADNTAALSLYEAEGFRPSEIQLEKRLG